MQDTQPLSSGGGNQDSIDIPLSHVWRDFFEWHMGTDGAWPRLHDLIDGRLRGSAKGAAAKITQENAGIVQDDTVLLARPLYAVLYVSQAIGEATGQNVPPHAVFGPEDVGLLPFCGQATRHPVDFAGDIVEDLGETEAFEPPRRSWAQISLRIVAVDDYRPLALKPGDGLFVELCQWDVPRSRQMLIRVYLRWQHLDELCSGFDKCLHLCSVDIRWHVISSAERRTSAP
jgi:hypothetical protein